MMLNFKNHVIRNGVELVFYYQSLSEKLARKFDMIA